jgi:hypothetical protein
MNGSHVDDAPERGRCLNEIALQNAVLCAECDVVSDSPHDTCLVCRSPRRLTSLVCLAATFRRIARLWFPQRQRKCDTTSC